MFQADDAVAMTLLRVYSTFARQPSGYAFMRKSRNRLARLLRDQLIQSFLWVFMVGCEPMAHGSLPEEPQWLPHHGQGQERAAVLEA